MPNFSIRRVQFSKIHYVRVSRRILTCLIVPFILFIDSASLFDHFLFLYLKCNILTSCWCCNFYLCLHPINLIFFFRSSVQDYHKLFLSSVVLGTKELNIGYNNAMSCYFNRKGNLSSACGNYECHYWLLFFFFSDWSALVVPVHQSSLGFSPLTCQL